MARSRLLPPALSHTKELPVGANEQLSLGNRDRRVLEHVDAPEARELQGLPCGPKKELRWCSDSSCIRARDDLEKLEGAQANHFSNSRSCSSVKSMAYSGI